MSKHTIGYLAADWTVETAAEDAVNQLRDRGDLPEGKAYQIDAELIEGYSEFSKETGTTEEIPTRIHITIRVADE